MGGAFGVLVMSQLNNQRAANQIFPFLILPQFFLAGVFSPIKNLPPVLFFLSRIAPMTYAVDFIRGVYYWGKPEYSKVVLFNPLIDFGVIAVLSVIMITAGTYFFINNERNR
jgi:ABC-2 type transport system permease protein